MKIAHPRRRFKSPQAFALAAERIESLYKSMTGDADHVLRRHNVRVAGNSSAIPTLVFSHGFGTDQTEWDPIVARLAADYRCVLLDHAGAGRSEVGSYNARRHHLINGHASDLTEIAHALNLQGSILVGHSAGGIIGLLAATNYTAHFSKLILIGATARYQNDDGYCGGFAREDLIELYRMMMTDYDRWLTQFVAMVTGKPKGDALQVYLAHMLARLEPDRALIMARSVLESDIRDWLPLVEQPTLILQTVDDPVVPQAAAEYLQRSIPRSQLKMLNAAGHFGFLDVPDETAAEIRAFASGGPTKP